MIKTEYNYVGIDASLSSTACTIRLKDGSEFYYNYRNTSKLSKWHKVLSYVTYRSYDNIKTDNYSDTEITKIYQYNKITDMMVADILSHCIPEETIIVTEGYSYSSSNTASLIDLIGYATLFRIKLISLPFNDFIIKPPSKLKLETCMVTYKPIIKEIGGKNPRTEYIYKNKIGIPGGSFQKHQILESIFDNDKIECQVKESLLFHKEELMSMKNLPKPIDDINDSIMLVYTEILQAII